MKHILRTIAGIACAITLTSLPSPAQTKDQGDGYNLRRAYEAMDEENDPDKALRLAEEQVRTAPGCTEAYILMCRILRTKGESGRALSSLNEAIKYNRPKKSGMSDAVLYWWKAYVYDDLGDKEAKALWLGKALEDARKNDREKVQRIAFNLGQAYFDLGRLEDSDEVYRRMLAEDETDQGAMVGLARNMGERGDHRTAVGLLDKAQKYDPEYPAVYQMRFRAHDALGETDKAIDDALTWLEKDSDVPFDRVEGVLMKHDTYALARMKSMLRTSGDKDIWKLHLIELHEKMGQYEEAIALFEELEKDNGHDKYIHAQKALYYMELGMYDDAVEEADRAIAMDDGLYTNLCKASILRVAGRYAEAVRYFDKALEFDPLDVFAHYSKGWCHELTGDDDSAMECYDRGIDLDRSYPYIYLMRGELLRKRGDDAGARADFEKVIALDTLAQDGSCRQYALCFLGKEQEAVDWMERIIEAEPRDAGQMYDYCCLLCRMGRTDEAVDKLGEALRMGYTAFEHIRHDDDVDPIRGRADFRDLVETYEAKLAARREKMSSERRPQEEPRLVEVPISRHSGGTFDVECRVNGLPLSMIFDTGASDVTISKVEADFMLKNRYLSKDDVKGRKYYQTADGGLTEGTVVTLREVSIGDAVLHNVEASVVKSQKAPLLLGESVLSRFGTFTVDNINSKLIIKH